MSSVSLKNIYKTFKNGTAAVLDLSLEIADGEFLVLCGPPGAGKSTLLRMLAGLETADSGEILFNREAAGAGVKERNVAAMLQTFSLFKFKSVYHNLAYGLRARKVDPIEIDKRIKEAAERLGLTDVLKLKPKNLFLEQRKKVQLARAIVRRPDLFLLDEPLKGLEDDERAQLFNEIIALQKELNITFIYATMETFDLTDFGGRVVILNEGLIAQTGTPLEIRKNPADKFVELFFCEESNDEKPDQN